MTTIILNVYPATTLRNLLADAKKSEMFDRGTAISTVLQNISYDSIEGIKDAVAKVINAETEEIMVCDAFGNIVYSTYTPEEMEGEELSEDFNSAALGFDVFRCKYDEESFRSSLTMPIMQQGYVSGTFHISQADTDSSKLLVDIRNNIFNISVFIVIFSGFIVLIFVSMFSSKVSALLKGVSQVGSGNYNYKVKDDGGDELSEVAKEFNKLSEKLQSLEKIRQEFVSNASHELKTPLASIKLLSDSIMQTDHMSKEDTMEFLVDINAEIDRLIRITENLLYITKTESRPVVVKETCNVSKIAERCRELLQANAGHRMIEVKVRTVDDCRVTGNNDMLYQVIFNIMENAIKYNKDGGTVSATVEKEGDMCKISIADTGIGMPEGEENKIFERFYRIDKARSRAIGGTGLGLSIVNDNIKLMNGTITVKSKLGEGSLFEIRLPLAEN